MKKNEKYGHDASGRRFGAGGNTSRDKKIAEHIGKGQAIHIDGR